MPNTDQYPMTLAPRTGPSAEPRARRPRLQAILRLVGTPAFLLAALLAILFAIAVATSAFADPPVRVVYLRADSANGTTHYPIPGIGTPWVNLAGGPGGSVENFHGTGASGWMGKGTHDSPYRLYWEGGKQRVIVPAASIPALQDSTAPVTAEMWFKTGFNGPRPEYNYLLEWVQPLVPGAGPEFEGKGMSICVQNGALQVYQNGWVEAAPVAPNAWYHVAVVKAPNDLRIYVNGQRVYTGTHPHMGAQLSPLAIGCSVFRYFEGYTGGAVYSDFFNGSIAQVSVWSGALNDAAVAASFANDSAQYLPNPPEPPLMKLASLRADSSNGASRYAVPGAGGPWVDLTGNGHSATLLHVAGVDTTSGWAGSGGGTSPARLQLDGVDDVAIIPAGSIPEMQELIPTTTQVWFKTGPDAASSTSHYVLEWLAGITSGYGMSLETLNGQLRIYRSGSGWTPVAAVGANAWYQATIVKRPGEMKVYVNGAPVLSSTRTTAGVQGTDLVIGGSTWRGIGVYGDYSNGAIGAVTLWQGVLDDGQVLASFLADSAGFIGPSTITAGADANGTISPSGAVTVARGGDQAFTLAPAPCYQVADVQVDGVSMGAVAGYTFTNVRADHTIAATFSLRSWTVTASAASGGSIAPAGPVAVLCGGDQAFAITPDACHTIADVLVDGVSAGALANVTLTDVQSDRTIAATFSLKSWTITASAGPDGSISPAGAVGVGCGTDATFTLIPGACRVVADVLVDGVSVGAVASYTFTAVQAPHTIAATFIPGNPTITASAGPGGSIAPSGIQALACGGNATYTVTPDPGYHILDVLVDGVSAGTGSSFPFTNVLGSHTISASFAIDTHALTTVVVGAGVVTRSPDGASYDQGTAVQLTATADPAWEFGGWSGDATGTLNPLTVLMTSDQSVTATFIHVDMPPAVQLTAPNGGEVLLVGNVLPVTWNATDDHAVTTVDLALSTDAGVNWAPIAAGLPNAGSYDWTLPATTSQTALVRITAHDAAGQTTTDASDAIFTLRHRLQSVMSFRADSASGTGPYPVPSAYGPWTDLARTNDALLHNFGWSFLSGWNGDGSPGAPYRLEYSGEEESVSLPPASVPELQAPDAVTAALWFRTASVPDTSKYYFLMEWEGTPSGGMSIAMHANQVMVYTSPWTPLATLAPGTWHHVLISKTPTEIRGYVDGLLRYKGSQSRLGGQQSSLVIGASTWRGPSTFGDYYLGAIAQASVWLGASTDSMARALFQRDVNLFNAGTLSVENGTTGLQLLGCTPNPARNHLRVSFSLPDARPARLELIDLAGRRVCGADVGAFGPGQHSVDLARDGVPPAGMYWVQLTQGGRSLATRVAVIR